MKLNQLPKTTSKPKKRIGRGYGSGKGGHTATRGAKGQKARGKLPLYFEGTAMRKSLIRRLPMLRGKLKHKSIKPKPIILNLKHLNLLAKNTKVDLDVLIKYGLVTPEAKTTGVKILGDGQLKHPLTIILPTSKSAAKKITKAGGKVIKPKTVKSGEPKPKPKLKSKAKPKPKPIPKPKTKPKSATKPKIRPKAKVKTQTKKPVRKKTVAKTKSKPTPAKK